MSDFRSDTVTQPSAGMRRAMAAAEVGDDVLDGDPTVRRLERTAAELLGLEEALFLPSGTMANQVALGAWTRPGDEVLCDAQAHLLSYEGGAGPANFGVQTRGLESAGGALDPSRVQAAIRPEFEHCPRTALIWVEQTHMASGGSLVPLERLGDLARVARAAGLPVHVDGARLFNAVVASGQPAERFAAEADSVAFCLSKGLGAPVGSLLAGPADFCRRARRVRMRLGGWMRQAGFLAAAGLWALEHNVGRLAEDHELAREVARALAAHEGLVPLPVETNIVIAKVAPPLDARELESRLETHGVRTMALDSATLRLVTHMDVGPPDVARLRAALEAVLARASPR